MAYDLRPATVAPSARKASRCGSSRRRPITSPPGGGICAEPKRASSGPASRNDARMRSVSALSSSADAAPAAQMATTLSPRHSAVAPTLRRSSIMASTSRMRGTLRSTTSSSVRSVAASAGRAAFLLPAGTTVPDSG